MGEQANGRTRVCTVLQQHTYQHTRKMRRSAAAPESNPCQYFLEHETQFSTIRMGLFTAYMMPAASAGAERMFSLTKRLAAPQRASMTAANLEVEALLQVHPLVPRTRTGPHTHCTSAISHMRANTTHTCALLPALLLTQNSRARHPGSPEMPQWPVPWQHPADRPDEEEAVDVMKLVSILARKHTHARVHAQ